MGSHRGWRRKTALRRKCDHCDLRFYSHFCLLIHLKIHWRSGWFRCSICKKPFKTLARFLKHGKHHIARSKPKRLCHRNVSAQNLPIKGESSPVKDAPSQVMHTSDEWKVSHSPPNKLVSIDGGEIGKHIIDNKEVESDYEITSDDKILKAVKFVEQLKALLKLDDPEQVESQDEPDVSHSLQVSEVTSSNLNGVNDSSSGTESEAQMEKSEEIDDAGVICKGRMQQNPNLKVNSASDKGKIVIGKEYCSLPKTTKRVFLTEASCSKKMRTMESSQAVVDVSGANSKMHMASEKSLLPITKFSCSTCRSRFFSYSQLKRHKRVIHKLYSKSESSGLKNSNMPELQSYHCILCLHQFDTTKKLHHHLRATHNVMHKSLKEWINSSHIQNSGNFNYFKHNMLDLGAKVINIKPGHLECSLCGANFLTYKGHKEHLKKKHNVPVSLLNGNKQYDGVKKNTKEFGKQGSVKDYSQYSTNNTDNIRFSQDYESGYNSDTSMKCKKCESVFDSVKERREHELKSHGLKVSFEGEQFVFLQMDMKVGTMGAAKNSKTSGKKMPIIDTEERFFNKLTKSCKLCSAKYVVFSSLQRHMLKRHNIRAYKLLPILHKKAKAKDIFAGKTKSQASFPGKARKEIDSEVSSSASRRERILQKQKPKGISSYPVKIESSKLGAPLPVSKIPGAQLEAISKKMGTSPRNLLIYRLEGLGSKLKGLTSNSKGPQGKMKLFVVKVNPPTGEQRHELGTKSFRKETENVTAKLRGVANLPDKTKFLSCRVVPSSKAVLSPKTGFLVDKAEAVLLEETAKTNKELLLSHRERSPLCNGMITLGEAGKSFEKSVNEVSVSSLRAETLSKVKEKNLGNDKAKENVSGMSTSTSNPVTDDNEIEKYLWHTNLSRKRFSCLICDISFSGYHIQRKHMLNYHGIHLDNHGKRVNPLPSLKQRGQKGVDSTSMTDKKCGNEVLSGFAKNSDALHPVSSHIRRGSNDEKLHIGTCDASQSTMLCDYENSMEESYEITTLEDGTQAYLCSHCPMHFKSLIDRLIHINDVHKSSTTPLPHCVARSQVSSPTTTSNEASRKECSSPKLKTVSQSLPGQVPKVKQATGKPPQIQLHSQRQNDMNLDKKKKKDPPGIYRCHLCDKVYRYYRGVYRHIRKFHKGQPLSRVACSVRNSSDARMLLENIQCHLCKRTFRALNYLTAHLKNEHGTGVGNGNTEISVLHSTNWNTEDNMGKVPENNSTRKQNRQIETVRSNLLAISIRDEPASVGDNCEFDNCNIRVDAQFEQEGEYIPVPPCDDESEFANEDVEIVEDNLFSRLQANLLHSSPQPFLRTEPTSLNYSVLNDDYNREGAGGDAEQNVKLQKNNYGSICLDVNEAQAASLSQGKIPNLKEKCCSKEASISHADCAIQFKPNNTDTSVIPEKHGTLQNHVTSSLEDENEVDDQAFICTIPGCSKSFRTKRGYDRHVSETCFLCHKRFSSSHNVRRHVREVHKIVNMLPCDLCGKEFPEPISLASHNRTEHLTPDMYVS